MFTIMKEICEKTLLSKEKIVENEKFWFRMFVVVLVNTVMIF